MSLFIGLWLLASLNQACPTSQFFNHDSGQCEDCFKLTKNDPSEAEKEFAAEVCKRHPTCCNSTSVLPGRTDSLQSNATLTTPATSLTSSARLEQSEHPSLSVIIVAVPLAAVLLIAVAFLAYCYSSSKQCSRRAKNVKNPDAGGEEAQPLSDLLEDRPRLMADEIVYDQNRRLIRNGHHPSEGSIPPGSDGVYENSDET